MFLKTNTVSKILIQYKRHISALALVCTISLSTPIFAQESAPTTMDWFKKHISYLADDKLEGRDTGSKGEKLAYEYITQQFEAIGLSPKGDDNSYIQQFEFSAGKELSGSNTLAINGNSLELNKDFYPLARSGNDKINSSIVDVGYGIKALDLNHNDYKKSKVNGKIALVHLGSPEGINPHSTFYPHTAIEQKIKTAEEAGAKAIILVNDEDQMDDPTGTLKNNVQASAIPVLFLKKEAYQRFGKLKKAALSTSLNIIKKKGHNVLGYLDNNAEYTVVIGGHYDHLGYGHYGSLHTGESAIHNGADDNASGVAVFIELARHLKNEKIYTNNNYLFIGFSGEELGLYGSNYYVKNPAISLESTNYMLNYDMVGRMDEDAPSLVINGTGTSEDWKQLAQLDLENLEIKTTDSGIGSSDHTNFYLNNVPAIHFFTGAHEDYHKPSDDEFKINYDGVYTVFDYTLKAIEELDDNGKLSFNKTDDQNERSKINFAVTLGVVPDYLYDGYGMKIDGVRSGRPAANAGIEDGDIVIKMGEYEVPDMMAYMKCLSLFKKGETTIVKVKRGDREVEQEVTF